MPSAREFLEFPIPHRDVVTVAEKARAHVAVKPSRIIEREGHQVYRVGVPARELLHALVLVPVVAALDVDERRGQLAVVDRAVKRERGVANAILALEKTG